MAAETPPICLDCTNAGHIINDCHIDYTNGPAFVNCLCDDQFSDKDLCCLHNCLKAKGQEHSISNFCNNKTKLGNLLAAPMLDTCDVSKVKGSDNAGSGSDSDSSGDTSGDGSSDIGSSSDEATAAGEATAASEAPAAAPTSSSVALLSSTATATPWSTTPSPAATVPPTSTPTSTSEAKRIAINHTWSTVFAVLLSFLPGVF